MPCPNPSVWFFSGAPVSEVRGNVWNVSDFAVCKRYDSMKSLKRDLALKGWLQENNIPVSSTFLTVDGMEGVCRPEGVYYLMSRLPGEHPSELLKDPEVWGRRFGRVLQVFHSSLASFPEPDLFPARNYLSELDQWLAPDKQLVGSAERELREVTGILDGLLPGLPCQLIHRDPHPGNFLFEQGLWTGVLDFELVRTEPRLVDVCYFLSSALEGFRSDDSDRWSRWKRFAGAFFTEYSLNEGEKKAFPVMLRSIPLLFVGFWKKPEKQEEELQTALFLADKSSDLSEVIA